MPEMTLWGEMHVELQNEKMIPTSEVDEYIIQLKIGVLMPCWLVEGHFEHKHLNKGKYKVD